MLLHMCRAWFAFLSAAVLLLSAAPAATQSRDPATFDIAGVRLGMTAEQVRAALAAAGYKPHHLGYETLGESFESKAHGAAQEQLNIMIPRTSPPQQALVGIRGERPDGSELSVVFLDWPDGPRVYGITYRAMHSGLSLADFQRAAQAKYGSPTYKGQKEDYWCSSKVPNCGTTMASRKQPYLTATRRESGQNSLTLIEGLERQEALAALARAEGAKIAAAVVKSGQGPVRVVAGSAADAARRDPSTFDVAGVKLGMPPEQATAALVAAGYRQSARFPPQYDLTFEQRVRLEADRRNGLNPDLPKGQGVQLLTFEHASGGQVRLGFINLREGARVNSVLYQVESDRTDLQTFRQRVAAKYGPPTLSRSTDDVWCAKTGTECGYQDISLSASRISAERGFLTLSLRDEEVAASNKLHAAVEAEVFKRTGKY